nr:STM3941 family protein [Allomuricauda sp.]
MASLRFYTSIKKALKLIGLSIPFVVMGIWFVTLPGSTEMDRFMGWAGILFFGLGVGIGTKQLFDRKVQIIIDENGIWDRSLKSGKIEWKYIHAAYPFDINGSKFISLVLDKEFESTIFQYKWATKLSHNQGAQKVNLNLAHVKADEKKLAAWINVALKKDIDERRALIKIKAKERF